MSGLDSRCQAMEELLTARLGGELEPAADALLSAHLATCAACAAEAEELAALWNALPVEPDAAASARMRARLDQAIAEERARLETPIPFPAKTTRVAAPSAPSGAGSSRRGLALAAMLLIGLGLGYFAFGRRGDDVAALRREVGDLHEMVALSLLQRGSASERLQGVAYGRTYANPGAQDERVVAALFARLLDDPDVNVRLAALEALRPIAAQGERRSDLVSAVAHQSSPLVALSLIDLLLESNEPAARRDLEQLLANEQLDPVVRGYLRDRLGRSA